METQGQNICMGSVRKTKYKFSVLVRLEMFSENTKLEGQIGW